MGSTVVLKFVKLDVRDFDFSWSPKLPNISLPLTFTKSFTQSVTHSFATSLNSLIHSNSLSIWCNVLTAELVCLRNTASRSRHRFRTNFRMWPQVLTSVTTCPASSVSLPPLSVTSAGHGTLINVAKYVTRKHQAFTWQAMTTRT